MYIDFVLSDDQSYDAGPGFDEVRLSGAYIVDGQLVHPRTIIDLAAGTARVPSYDLAFPFAGADDLDAELSALTWYGTDRRDRVEADPTFSETARRFIAYGRGGNDRIRGTEKADFIDGGAGYDRADGYAGRDECVAVEVMRSC